MKVKLLNEKAKLPTRSSNSAGLDIYSPDSGVILPNERKIIKAGISIALPPNHYGHIFGRSGLAVKNGIMIMGGVIDNDYRGEIGVIAFNSGSESFHYNAGERIAQMIILPYSSIDVEEVESLEVTERGSGAYGSTGRF